MTTKQWLQRGWRLNKEVQALQSAKRQAFYTACNSTAILSDVPCRGGGNATENKLCSYADYSQLLDEHMQALFLVKLEILREIAKVDNSTYRTLLTERYINFKKWDEIADVLGYSKSHIETIMHPKALNCIGKYIL